MDLTYKHKQNKCLTVTFTCPSDCTSVIPLPGLVTAGQLSPSLTWPSDGASVIPLAWPSDGAPVIPSYCASVIPLTYPNKCMTVIPLCPAGYLSKYISYKATYIVYF